MAIPRAGLGLTYAEEGGSAAVPPSFTNTFVNPSSYRAFMETGRWPNGTVFILEIRRSATEAAPNNGGRFQAELSDEAEVRMLVFQMDGHSSTSAGGLR